MMGKWISNLTSPPLATFPTSFPTDFGGKLAEKIANGSHMIAGYLATVHKYKQAAKSPKCDHMTRRRPNLMYRENKKMTPLNDHLEYRDSVFFRETEFVLKTTVLLQDYFHFQTQR